MKPWEETWRLERLGPGVRIEFDQEDGEDFLLSKEFTEDRARLAACAPEMARLLLEAEWANFEHIHGGGVSECPWCTESRNDYGKHRDSCPWLALMKKAGIR